MRSDILKVLSERKCPRLNSGNNNELFGAGSDPSKRRGGE